MGLLKLFSNRISREWKEKFNKNIDYLNNLEKKLSDQDKSTNSRIDNLVLHSGGESHNEVVDARVNHKEKYLIRYKEDWQIPKKFLKACLS